MSESDQSFISVCSSCDARLRLPAKVRDRRIRCPKCQEPTLAAPVDREAKATRIVEVPRAPERTSKPLLIPCIVLALLVAAGVGWWASSRNSTPSPNEPSTATDEPASETDVTPVESDHPETPTVTEEPAPAPPKTPIEALLALADPTQRSHVESLQVALASNEPAASEERDRWLALLRDPELQQPLAWWLTEEWFHAPEWSRRIAAVRLVPEFGSSSREALLDAASKQFVLAHFAAKLTVELAQEERAARELTHGNPLRRFAMAAAIRHWKNPPEAVLSGLVHCLTEVPGDLVIQAQCVSTFERLVTLEGPGPKRTLTPVQSALMEIVRDLAQRRPVRPRMGEWTSDRWFPPLGRILFDSGLRDTAALDELLAIFLDEEELRFESQRSRRLALAALVEDRPEARSVWEEKLRHCEDLVQQRKTSGWERLIGEFGCDLKNWDTVVELAGRGHNTYQTSLALSTSECRSKLFAYVEAGGTPETHTAISTDRWAERYRRHPEYANLEVGRFCQIALDESRSKEVREAAIGAIRGMGGVISLTPKIERVAESKYGVHLLGPLLKNDRRALIARYEQSLKSKTRRSQRLASSLFISPPTSPSELDVLATSLGAGTYSSSSPAKSWAPLGASTFHVEARNSVDWQLAVLAHAPYEVASAIAGQLDEATKEQLAARFRTTWKEQPSYRRRTLMEWLPTEDPPEFTSSAIVVLDHILDRYRQSAHHDSLLSPLKLIRGRLQADSDDTHSDFRVLMRENPEVQLAMLRALSIWDASSATGLMQMLQPVEIEVLPFMPIFERVLAARNARHTSLPADSLQKLLVSLLSGGIALEGW